MGNRLKGTLAGVLCSLIAVGLWIFMSAVLGIIAGVAGALMGILFIIPYTKINPDDRSAYPYALGALLIVVEIVVAEFISLAIIAATLEAELGSLLAVAEISLGVVYDLVVGFVLSAICFVCYILMLRRQKKQVARRRTDAGKTSIAPKDDTSESSDPFGDGPSDDSDGGSGGGWKTE